MSRGAIERHTSGTLIGERKGTRDLAADASKPPWRSWRTRSRASRCIRWIETYVVVPSGAGANQRLRLAGFQRDGIEELLAPSVRTGGLQIPRGNAKSTLWAAVGLWALCDHADMPQIPLVAFNSLQAQRTLFKPLTRMVTLSPELRDRVVVYTSERRIWSAWNAGELLPLPADVERLQGLNPTIALVDEAQTVEPDVFGAVLQGAGKRAESLVLAIGTPAPGAQSSALYDLRERARAGAPIRWIEYAAAPGCALDDDAEIRKANPAIDAGILFPDVIAHERSTVDEIAFRSYRLGQWLDVSVSSWLPAGAWAELPYVAIPPDGTEIVLAVAGSWRSSIAVMGATLDGELFLAWSSETATDEDLRAVLDDAADRWSIREVVFAPRIRPALVRDLVDVGYPVFVWPLRGDLDATTSADFRAAIVEGRIAHDHDDLVGAHVAAVVGRAHPDGTLRLDAPNDETDIDAARAARMAWARARDNASTAAPAIY